MAPITNRKRVSRDSLIKARRIKSEKLRDNIYISSGTATMVATPRVSKSKSTSKDQRETRIKSKAKQGEKIESENKLKANLVTEENLAIEKTPETVGNKKTPQSRKRKIETPKVDENADEDKTSVQENSDEIKDAEFKEEEKEVEPRRTRSTRSTRSAKVTKVDATPETKRQTRGSKKDEEHADLEFLETETVVTRS
uniref:Uncharacterized protein n=1 Tax=Panagrolaimus sp. JU765 TaxID=591449 RepID=A0AC34R2Z3_9BILA